MKGGISNMNPLLLTDVYKTVHHEQYPDGMTELHSYLIPRKSRNNDDFLIMFGLSYYVRKFIIEDFQTNFFNLTEDEAVAPYEFAMKHLLGERFADTERWRKLHRLGYLPITIYGVPEGTKVPIQVPMIEIYNTHPDFAWLVNYIETSMQCTLWHIMAAANVGYNFRQIVRKWYDKTVVDAPEASAICDFSMRGQQSVEAAAAASAAFLLSFNKTATIPAFYFLQKYYKGNPEQIATGLASTEHSVMCTNTAVDGNEKDMIVRLLTQIYPNDNFSMVSDSYDYWNLVCNILREPDVKAAVLNHNGFIGIRGDSGDPVDIVAGKLNPDPNVESDLGTVEVLWNIFGGTINSKGYKVLNPHVKAVYGDGITKERAEEIYRRLEAKGFAANNVSLGMGAYSMQSADGNTPLTRDTYGIAVKSTYCCVNDKNYPIFKNPKTDTGEMKKSPKGLLFIYRDTTHANQLGCVEMTEYDQVCTIDDGKYNAFIPYYLPANGDSVNYRNTLDIIRDRLHDGRFNY